MLSHGVLTIIFDSNSWFDMHWLFPMISSWWSGDTIMYADPSLLAPGDAAYRYPPFWAVTMLPLIELLPLRPAIAAWGLLSVVAFFGSLALVVRHLELRVSSVELATLLLAIALFGPFYETFIGPTKELVLFALMATTFVLSDRSRPVAAGLSFGAAILLKIYPAFFGLYFLLRRDFRTLFYTAVWFVVLNVFTITVSGFADTYTFFFELLPSLGGSSVDPENAGFVMLLMGIEHWSWFDHGLFALQREAPYVVAGIVWRLLVVAGFVSLMVALERRGAMAVARTRFMLFATWTSAVLVLIPVSWMNYQIFLAFPMVAVVVWASERKLTAVGATAVAVFVVSILYMSTPIKAALLWRYVDPGMKAAHALSTGVGYELGSELEARVLQRRKELGIIGDATSLEGSGRREVKSRLAEHAVSHGGSRASEYEHLRSRIVRVRARNSLPVAARFEARVRRAGLTTNQVIAFVAARSGVGVAAFLSMMLLCTTRPGVGAHADGSSSEGPSPRHPTT